MICAHEGRPDHEQLFAAWGEPGDPLEAAYRIAQREQAWSDRLAVEDIARVTQRPAEVRPPLEW